MTSVLWVLISKLNINFDIREEKISKVEVRATYQLYMRAKIRNTAIFRKTGNGFIYNILWYL